MTEETPLDDLRRQIDAIDTKIHNLLMRRTEVVAQVTEVKRNDTIKIRPSRENEILYRLIARHKGPFPKRELSRIWRELIMATLSMEGPFSVAVFMPEADNAYWDLARDHYGTHTPMAGHTSVRRVIEAVRSGDATVGILPLPRSDDHDPWWRHLVTSENGVPRVIARLPFAGPGNARTNGMEALAICPVIQEKTGRDRSFLAIEAGEQVSLDRLSSALKEVNLPPAFMSLWNDKGSPATWQYLVEVDDFVAADDSRVSRILDVLGRPATRALTLGGYGIPLGEKELATAPAPAPRKRRTTTKKATTKTRTTSS